MTEALILGDCVEVMAAMAAESVDACVTDPPYGIGFMGKEWDTFRPRTGATRKLMHPRERAAAKLVSDNPNIHGRHRSPALSPSQIEYDYSATGLRKFQTWTERWAVEAFRILKPGGYILVCGAPRAYHRMACGIEDAGFEIRDCLAWIFGSGFPKGLSVVNEFVRMAVCQSFETVSRAAQSSACIRVRSGEGKGSIAVALARILPAGDLALLTEIGGEVALHVPTDTWPSEWMERIGLNMTCSSSESLDASWQRASKCIIETARETTTDERTFSWLTGLHTSEITTRCSVTLQNGSEWPAVTVKRSSSGAITNTSAIRIVTALGSATWNPVVRHFGSNIALKPAHEPILLARKPFKGTVRANIEKYGTGALNIDACRLAAGAGGYRGDEPSAKRRYTESGATDFAMQPGHRGGSDLGRWPANVVIDDVAALVLDEQSGELVSGANPTRRGSDKFRGVYGDFAGQEECKAARGVDIGGASRFFYCAKPSRAERDIGCWDLPALSGGDATDRQDDSAGLRSPRAGAGRTRGGRNGHPTVKPVELMRWLVRLVTPVGGTVIDPFLGSGTTGIAARFEQRPFIGIEREAEYLEIAERRIAACVPLFADSSPDRRPSEAHIEQALAGYKALPADCGREDDIVGLARYRYPSGSLGERRRRRKR